MRNAETVDTVHTHTHTHTICSNERNVEKPQFSKINCSIFGNEKIKYDIKKSSKISL